jgi:hypothetical protein
MDRMAVIYNNTILCRLDNTRTPSSLFFVDVFKRLTAENVEKIITNVVFFFLFLFFFIFFFVEHYSLETRVILPFENYTIFVFMISTRIFFFLFFSFYRQQYLFLQFGDFEENILIYSTKHRYNYLRFLAVKLYSKHSAGRYVKQ